MTILLDTGRWAAVQEKKNKTTEKIHGSSEGGLVRQKRMMEAGRDGGRWFTLVTPKKSSWKKTKRIIIKKDEENNKKEFVCVGSQSSRSWESKELGKKTEWTSLSVLKMFHLAFGKLLQF